MSHTIPVSTPSDKRSLATRVTVQLSLVIGLLFVVAAGFVGLDIRARSIAESVAALQSDQQRFAQQEEARFAEIAVVEQRASTMFEQLLQDRSTLDPKLFDRLFPIAADGTRRSADDLFDDATIAGIGHVHGFGAFIQSGERLSLDDKQQLLAAFKTLHQMGAGLSSQLRNLYFYTPHNALIMFAPDRPDRLDFYRHKAPPDFDFQREEFSVIMEPANNPQRMLRCTSLQPILFDRRGKTWTTGCMTPVQIGARHVGNWGVSILLEALPPGPAKPIAGTATSEILVSRDGKLILHPEYTSHAGVASAASLDLVKTGDPRLQKLWAFIVAQRGKSTSAGYARDLDAYFAIGTLPTPGWYALTLIPAKAVNGAALRAASGLVWIGVLSVLVQILVLRLFLRRNVGDPITALARRATQIAASTNDPAGPDHAVEPGVEGSEIDRLNASFDSMEARVSQERRRLKRSFDLFAANVEHVALFMLDAHGRILNWNKGAENITGYSGSAAVGMLFSALFDPAENVAGQPAALLAAAASGKTGDAHALIGRDGHRYWASLRIEQIRSDTGAAIGFAIILHDITLERQQANQAQESLRLLTMAEASAQLGHWRLDLATRTVAWSLWTYRIHGVAPGTPIRDSDGVRFYEPSNRGDIAARFDAARASRESFGFRAKIVRADGALRDVEIKGQAEYDAGGTATALFGVLRDITDQMANESALIAAREAADATARARTDFLAIMSHEIRTPLSGIIGMLDTIDAASDAPDRGRSIASIQRSSHTLMRVLDDVLDHSAIETGSLRLEVVPFDLAELVEQTGDLFRAAASAKGVDLVCRGPPAIWVSGDPTRVQQIIANFVGNAVKFTSIGRIEIDWHRDATGLCRIEVRDTGIGIAADALPRLFAAFVQATPSTVRQFGGTGLGLAIGRRLAEAMEGSVGAESQLGIGSCFWAELPLAPAAPAALPEPAVLAPLLNANGQPPFVLLADDTESARLATTAQLEAMGCRVDTAVDGVAALALMVRAPYDIIILDGSMPGLGGGATTRLAGLLPGGGPSVLGLTAHSQPAALAALRDAGMASVLTKPVRRAALHQALLPLVQHRRPPRADAAVAAARALAAFPAALRKPLADSIRRDLASLATSAEAALAGADRAAAATALHGLRGVAQTLGASDLAAIAGFAEAVLAATDDGCPLQWLADAVGGSAAFTLADVGQALATAGQAA